MVVILVFFGSKPISESKYYANFVSVGAGCSPTRTEIAGAIEASTLKRAPAQTGTHAPRSNTFYDHQIKKQKNETSSKNKTKTVLTKFLNSDGEVLNL